MQLALYYRVQRIRLLQCYLLPMLLCTEDGMYENNKIRCTRQLLQSRPLIGLSFPAKIGYRLSAVPVEPLSKH